MSNLKDTEFEDLFRRASEKYPLRTDSADWDRMAAALEKDPSLPPDDSADKRKRRRFLWLLLFLPLACVGYYTWQGHGHMPATGAGVVKTGGAVKVKGGSVADAGGAAASSEVNVARGGATASSGRGVTPAGAETGVVRGKPTDGKIADGETTDGMTTDRTTTDRTGEPGGGSDTWELQGVDLALIPHDYRLAVKVTAPAAVKDSSHPKKAAVRHFYAGIVGSPDLSTVRMQAVKGTGSTFGVILGYAFNSRWAIETGVYVDRKHYYTDGEYFSTKEVNLPVPGAELVDVNGVCYMWEIPLNIRYNFNPGAKTAWFATAGFSTYLMSREKYAYGWKWPSGTNVWDSSWNIKRPSQYPFSVINLSAGFEQRLGKIGSLRLEPFVRIPLTGMGVGKLPIMSAGVNIGITRQLW